MCGDIFFPKKSFGQNFLVDKNIAKKIVELIGPNEEDKIIEIGPGKGALTQYLVDSSGYVLGIEKDKTLAFFLKRELCVDVVLMDAMKFPWSRIRGKFNKIIGNLPYNIASSLIWDIVSNCGMVEKMVFTVQREVAQKIGARVGDKKYGVLSVWVQTFCDVKLGFTIGPSSFSPPPKVVSQVVVFSPKRIDIEKDLKKRLIKTLRICFSSPRKQIGNLLKNYWNPVLKTLFEKRGLKKDFRPQRLTPQDFMEISKVIF